MTLYRSLKLCLTRLFIACFLLCASHSVFALQAQSTVQWYQIEMIFFSHLSDGELDNETWPLLPAFNAPSEMISLVPPQIYPTQPLSNYPLVLPNDFILNDEAAHLSNNPDYQMIGHLAWLQPITSLPQSKIIPTYVQASNNQSIVDTLLQIRQNKFIEISMQALLSIQDAAFSGQFKSLKALDNKNNDGQIRFQINQSIRMKTKELNYIDSPFLGILIEIIPHAAPT
jgi:hypothetical protein